MNVHDDYVFNNPMKAAARVLTGMRELRLTIRDSIHPYGYLNKALGSSGAKAWACRKLQSASVTIGLSSRNCYTPSDVQYLQSLAMRLGDMIVMKSEDEESEFDWYAGRETRCCTCILVYHTGLLGSSHFEFGFVRVLCSSKGISPNATSQNNYMHLRLVKDSHLYHRNPDLHSNIMVTRRSLHRASRYGRQTCQ